VPVIWSRSDLLKPVADGWSWEHAPHQALWEQSLPKVERRPLEIFEEVERWN
jgi:hypothetical protein